MFEFHNPAAFLMLLLIPLLFLLRYLKIFTQVTYPAVLADWNGQVFHWKGKLRKFFTALVKFLLMAGFTLAVAAFADPVLISQEKIYTSLSTDVIFVLDTSPSMAARDVDGMSRLQASKQSVTTLLHQHDGLRYGLVALGSNASVYVPPTHNIQVFENRLREVNVGILGNGSAIGDGLSTAVCHLASSNAPKKCVILFTDGENNAGEIHPETAAKLAHENNITLYVVGVGSRGTVPIEYTDPVTGKLYSGYLDSDFNPASLKKIAGIADGSYFEVRTLQELYTSLNAVIKTESVIQNYSYKTKNNELYQKFILVALILVILAWFLKHIILQERNNIHVMKVNLLRTILLGFAFTMMVLAFHGFSWGTYLVPIQKSGTSVSFVFDISNSMNAKDGPNGTSRLEASAIYAKKLLAKMDGTAVSVVLSKGEGIEAIPLTEDTAMLESLLDVLSSDLMTAPGTSLEKGILCGKNSFPQNYASAGRVWVFTDGEETNGEFTTALSECIKSGIPVTIIGFGTGKEINVLAGDKKTVVRTALREQEILNSIEEAGSKLKFYRNQTPVTYVNSSEKGSALKLLNQLTDSKTDNQTITYEAKPIPRYKLFLILALFAFAFSYIFSEFDFKKAFKKGRRNAKAAAGLLAFTMFFTGCKSSTMEVLKGTYSWRQKQFRHSISYFLNACYAAQETNNQQMIDVAIYDLGTAYQMLGEDTAALERYNQISEEATQNVRFAAFYNSGVIAHSNEDYEKAQEYFRKALEVDNSKINAKINLELSMQMIEAQSKQAQGQATPAAQEETDIPDLEKGVFEHIKENDQKQWKNSETPDTQNLENDY